MTTAYASQDLAPLLERLFLFDAFEGSYEITGITGRVPSWLQGTYYLNGPARFERSGHRYNHWLDGDGMIASLRFTADGISYTSRFVGTPKLRDEAAEGRFLYRGFGTAFPGDRLRRKVMLEPPVNVSVQAYDGRLLAFGEQTLPYELNPVTLDTVGEYDFQGSLNELSPFSAHAKLDSHLMNFGISFSATQPLLHVYEFDHAGRLLKRRRFPLLFQHSVHDFGITRHHAVFFLSPLLMNFQRFWDEGRSVMESLSWEPERGSTLLITPRVSSDVPAFSVDAGRGYCLHFINCFEQGNRLMIDVLELDEPVYPEYQPVPDLFATVPLGRPVRFVVDIESRKLIDRIELNYDRSPDFPSIENTLVGVHYDDFWMTGISESGRAGRKFFNELAHGSWKTNSVNDIYRVPAGEYLGGEPVYVGNGEEGVVLVQHFMPASDRSEYLVFDGAAVRNGPIARLPLRHRAHPGFHATFHKTTLQPTPRKGDSKHQ
ncbi:MAG: carotenoid oxygenase family protein [Bryobacteraceae bacterium]|jgi:all-trans-8'-apo-beta-carotenal 15,15'-oxygenase